MSGVELNQGTAQDSILTSKKKNEARGWNADDPEDAVEQRLCGIPFSRTDLSASTQSHGNRLCGALLLP